MIICITQRSVITARDRILLHRSLLIKVDSTIKPKFKLPIIDTNHYTK